MTSWFDLNGSFLRIDAADPELLRPLLIYLDELQTDPRSRAAAFTFILERGSPAAEPASARLLFEGPLPEAPISRLCAGVDSRSLIIPDRLSMEYSISDRIARFRVAPGDEKLVGGTAAIYAIHSALFATGQTLVHAAALRLPHRDEALILFAPSGAGKTTTSLALALQGFGLLTDDATVLAAGNGSRGRTNVWGLPRPPKVHQRTAQMLPAIGQLLGANWNSDGEQAVSPKTLKAILELTPGRAFPLSALILLGERVTGAHRLRPMRKADLFAHFANDNVSRSPDGVLNEELSRFQRFVSLVASTPAYQLNVGSDLSTLGETITAVLGGADQAILSA